MRKYRAKKAYIRALRHALDNGVDENLLFTLHCKTKYDWHEAHSTTNPGIDPNQLKLL